MEQKNKLGEKLTEKAFSRLLLASILGMLLCMACLCSATWALYTADVTNNSNVLTSGNFCLEVTATDEDSEDISVVKMDGGISVCTFAPGTYTVTLTICEDATVSKGFCVMKVGERVFRSASIHVEDTEPFEFTLVVDEEVTVRFTPAWGLPAEYHVDKNGTLVIAEEE